MDEQFIPLIELDENEEQTKREREKAIEKRVKRDKKLFKLFKGNETVRHVYAVIQQDSHIRPLDIAYQTILNYEEVRSICRQLTDRLILWDYYSPIYPTLKDNPRTFSGYLRQSYLHRDEGDYHRDAIVAVLEGRADDEQKRLFERQKARWIEENQIKLLEMENTKLRMDLKMALARKDEAEGLLFLEGVGKRKSLVETLAGQQTMDEMMLDKAYDFCKGIMRWRKKRDFKATVKSIQNAKKLVDKNYSQEKAILLMITQLAKAYVKLYESKVI